MAALKSYRKGPAILAGALSLLMLSCIAAVSENLPESLFEEQQWRECYSECLRILHHQPDNHSVQLLSFKAAIKLGSNPTNEITAFVEQPGIDRELKCEADFLLADIHIRDNKPAEALDCLKYCFNNTQSGQLFASATKQANSIMNNHPELEKSHPELISIIRTASKTWPRLQNKTSASKTYLAKPALWAVAFYGSQISPAIGARCSLHPSCSAYAVEALKKHGAKGIALAGDRMVREPDVVALKATPVAVGNLIKYADPVTDHDFWLEREKQ